MTQFHGDVDSWHIILFIDVIGQRVQSVHIPIRQQLEGQIIIDSW